MKEEFTYTRARTRIYKDRTERNLDSDMVGLTKSRRLRWARQERKGREDTLHKRVLSGQQRGKMAVARHKSYCDTKTERTWIK